ncbi:MAG: hypothetical protein WC840_03450 [Candidatus Peribacteraceae bacterium]
MKSKKSRTKVPEAIESRSDTPVGELGQKETLMHYNAVLIEDLTSKMQLVIESMQAMGSRIDTQFEDMESRINARFKDMESRINIQFRDIEARFGDLRKYMDNRFLTLEGALRGVKGDILILDSKFDRLCPRIDNHDQRIAALEQA